MVKSAMFIVLIHLFDLRKVIKFIHRLIPFVFIYYYISNESFSKLKRQIKNETRSSSE